MLRPYERQEMMTFREQSISSALVNGMDARIHMDYGLDGDYGYDVDVYIIFDNPSLNPSEEGWLCGSVFCRAGDKQADIERQAMKIGTAYYAMLQRFVTNVKAPLTQEARADALLTVTDYLRAQVTQNKWLTNEVVAKNKKIDELEGKLAHYSATLAKTERLLGQCIAGKLSVQEA